MKVCWLSAGVSSAVAAFLDRPLDKLIYIHIDDQHEDSLRFVQDVGRLLDIEVEILQSRYKSVDEVQKAFQFINSAYGAKCTDVLKKRVRKEWEAEHRNDDITYIWGYDCTEQHRAGRLVQAMPGFAHSFPLIDRCMTKEDAHGLLRKLGIRRPAMYDMGYQNNNCIGCVKGGMGYWNRIRRDFPDRFAQQAQTERMIGRTCLRRDGKPLYLDELSPDSGRDEQEILDECGIMCEIAHTSAMSSTELQNL